MARPGPVLKVAATARSGGQGRGRPSGAFALAVFAIGSGVAAARASATSIVAALARGAAKAFGRLWGSTSLPINPENVLQVRPMLRSFAPSVARDLAGDPNRDLAATPTNRDLASPTPIRSLKGY